MLSFRAPFCPTSNLLSVSSYSPLKLHIGSVKAVNFAFRDDEKEETVLLRDTPDPENIPDGLCREFMPRHVAVIMDGNARWARRRGLPTSSGHEAGVQSLKELIEMCCNWGIRVLTVFAFSCDNWTRPKVPYFWSNWFFSVYKYFHCPIVLALRHEIYCSLALQR